jgi:hypothetical protein
MLLAFSGSALAESPIITYDVHHDLLENNNPEPLLSIYADGKARAVYPEYMKKAGVYEWQLSDAEMQAVRKLAGKPGIQEFDEQAVSEKIEENENDDDLSFYISDSTRTVIDVKEITESGEVIEGATAVDSEPKVVSFEDVPEMAEEHPEITELSELKDLQSQLETILEQADQPHPRRK